MITLITNLPLRADIFLPFVVLAAHLARERHLRALVGALVDHQVVRLGEPALAVLAHELALWPHLRAEVAPTVVVVVDSQRREIHFRCRVVVDDDVTWVFFLVFIEFID